MRFKVSSTILLFLAAITFGACSHRATEKRRETKPSNNGVVKKLDLSVPIPCSLGDVSLCTKKAALLSRGNDGPFDLKRAKELLIAPCTHGDAASCYKAGFYGMLDAASEQSQQEAEPFYERACELDNQYCAHFGQLLLRSAKDRKSARAYLQMACDAKSPRGCRALALESVWDAGLGESPLAFKERSIEACKLEGKEGCEKLAHVCSPFSQRARLCSRETKSATRVTRYVKVESVETSAQSCTDDKDAAHCYALAHHLLKEKKKGIQYFELGCRHGSPESCAWVAYIYDKDKSVKHSPLALKAWKEMCLLKEKMGCGVLSVRFAEKMKVNEERSEKKRVWAKLSCDAFDPVGCYMNASLSTSKTFKIKHFRHACFLGNSGACTKVARAAWQEQNDEASALFSKHACALHSSSEACLLAARTQARMGEVGQAQSDYRQLCQNDPAACEPLAALIESDPKRHWESAFYRRADAERFYKKSSARFQKLCAEENASACAKLSHAYLYGEGLSRDIEQGIAHAKKACTTNPSECVSLMRLYEKGTFIKRDLNKALKLAAALCKESHSACVAHDRIKAQISGSLLDKKRYLESAERSCERERSCHDLAEGLIEGDMLEKDLARAESLIGESCGSDRGSHACYLLARERLKKQDPKSVKMAQGWLRVGCARHNVNACALWAQNLNAGIFEPTQKKQTKYAMFRACLEGSSSLCADYKKQYGAEDEYIRRAQSAVYQNERVQFCRRGTHQAIAWHFEVNEKGIVDVSDLRDECVSKAISAMHFATPSSALEVIVEFDDTVQRAPFEISTDKAPRLGSKSAPIEIVIFGNIADRFSFRALEDLKKMNEIERLAGKVTYVWKYRFFERDKLGFEAAIAAEAVRSQNEDLFWPFVQKAFENHKDLNAAMFIKVAEEIGVDIKRYKRDLKSKRARYVARVEKDVEDMNRIPEKRGIPSVYVNGWTLTWRHPQKVMDLIDNKGLLSK